MLVRNKSTTHNGQNTDVQAMIVVSERWVRLYNSNGDAIGDAVPCDLAVNSNWGRCMLHLKKDICSIALQSVDVTQLKAYSVPVAIDLDDLDHIDLQSIIINLTVLRPKTILNNVIQIAVILPPTQSVLQTTTPSMSSILQI